MIIFEHVCSAGLPDTGSTELSSSLKRDESKRPLMWRARYVPPSGMSAPNRLAVATAQVSVFWKFKHQFLVIPPVEEWTASWNDAHLSSLGVIRRGRNAWTFLTKALHGEHGVFHACI